MQVQKQFYNSGIVDPVHLLFFKPLTRQVLSSPTVTSQVRLIHFYNTRNVGPS